MAEYSPSFLSLEERVLSYMDGEGMLKALPSGVLLALSGGADSVFLLHILARLAEKRPFRLFALHVHHHLRGAEADRDAAFCVTAASKLSVPCALHDVDVLAEAERGGVEAAARRLRYRSLRSEKERLGLGVVATAHHATDHLETLLYQMLRGGGIRALLGIRPMQGDLMRPLLVLSRKEIEEALLTSHIPYVTDTTNEDRAYTRNRLRGEVLPPLVSALPSAERGARRLSEALSHDAALLDSLADEALLAAPRMGEGIEADYLRKLPEALRRRLFVRLYEEKRGSALSDVPLEHTHITALSRLLLSDRPSFSLSVPCRLYARLRDGSFFFAEAAGEEPSLSERPLYEGENTLPGGFTVTLSYRLGDAILHCSSKLYKIDIMVAFSRDIIEGELTVRGRIPGDAYFFRGHTHSLKTLYNEKKIPLAARPHLPLICDQGGILWMPLCPVREKGGGDTE